MQRLDDLDLPIKENLWDIFNPYILENETI